MSIRLVTLGVPSCYAGDVELAELPAQKARFALLVYLAVERNVSRDEVTALFWPDSDDDRARHALSQSLYELKRLLGDPWVQSRSGRLVVSDDVGIDAREFTQLCDEEAYERAVNLYRGPFLSGFFLSNCKGFETWVDRQRAQLERTHRRARRECVNQLVEAKRLPEAIDVARRWVELDPYEDEANHRLIELLTLAGARADALREFTGYERRLREDLAIEPLENTKSLIEALRRETGAAENSSQPAAESAGGEQPAESITPRRVIGTPRLVAELSRRRVFRMALWYGATAFAMIQFVQAMADAFRLPPWILTATAVLTIAGFPLAVLLSWHFDVTPGGVDRTPAVSTQASPRTRSIWTLPTPVSAIAIIGIFVFGAVLWFGGFERNLGWSAAGEAFDTTHFAILPFNYGDNVEIRLNEQNLLQDALSRWTDITVVDLFQVHDAVAQAPTPLRPQDALLVSRNLRAGRYVRGTVVRFGDTLRVHAALYDANDNGTSLVDRTIKLPINLSGADSAFAEMADDLLLATSPTERPAEKSLGTRSWSARRSFAVAQSSIREWNLARADSQLAAAVVHDPAFTQAYLWLAQVRAWTRADAAQWRYAALNASADTQRLSPRDKNLALAVEALSRGEYMVACSLYRELAASDPRGFVAWYGLADCLHRDMAVIRDAASPSGFAFRTSYAEVIRAYTKAFEIMPSIHKALHGNSYQRIRRLLFTSARDQRFGNGVDDTTRFSAYATWQGDSLATIPFKTVETPRPRAWWNPVQTDDAIKHQRRLFHNVTAGWVAAFPNSPEAIEAIAVALEMLGNSAALDSLRRARAITLDPKQKARLAVNEVFVQLKFSLPDDLKGVRRARALADSILNAEEIATTPLPRMLASVASLTGRAHLAAQYNQQPLSLADKRILPEIGRAALALESFAALGGPGDSLRILDSRIEAAILNNVVAEEQAAIRSDVFLRTAPLALPVHGFGANAALALEDYPPLVMAAGASSGNVRAVKEMKARTLSMRKLLRATDLSLDALVPEAWALQRIGDIDGAISWLDPTLRHTRFSTPGLYSADPVLSASLARAIVLRADLAHASHDQNEARRWAAAAVVLWSDCDTFLQPVLRRLKTYAARR